MQKYWKSGDPYVWLTGGALALSVLMIAGLVVLILVNGLQQFWPSDVVELQLKHDRKVLGEIWNREVIPQHDKKPGHKEQFRLRLKIGNRDVYSLDFKWIDEKDIEKKIFPENALVLERMEWGNFYGMFKALKVDDKIVATNWTDARQALQTHLQAAHALHKTIDRIEKDDIGGINYRLEALRLRLRRIQLQNKDVTDTEKITDIQAKMKALQQDYKQKEAALSRLYEQSKKVVLVMNSIDGQEKAIKVFDIVRLYAPNNMNVFQKAGLYAGRVWEFVSGEPRESNTEGGIFPAIFGTVMLVVIMSIAVVPLGVLAAVYLREYAKQGLWVRAIRIAVNNLAGVPSIVYGIFGLGFFIYTIGGSIDKLFYAEALPTPTFGTGGILWASLTLALLTVPVVIVATEEGLAAVPRAVREGSMALSATKFETLWRVVLPGAMPGILTGMILAIARAAGEVAPLMITGVVKLAPSLPLDGYFPFLHLERKFMHLGFHIYDVGFQSPNVEAALPMVYSTTLLLLLIVVLLNVIAIVVRNRMRKKIAYSVF